MMKCIIAPSLALPCLALALAFAIPSTANAAEVEYSSWKYNQEKGYHYKKATFPEGGYQYLLYKPDKPGWVYWYNPKKSQVWCACPTKKNKDYGDKIRAGGCLYLKAMSPGKDIESTKFAPPNNQNMKSQMSVKDEDGSDVNLDAPPTDLP